MPGIAIPEVEALRESNPEVFQALSRIAALVQAPTVLRGKGSPEGAIAAPPGTLYVPNDPKMGDALFQKVNGNGASGWAAIPSGQTGGLIYPFPIGGSTASAVFVALPSGIAWYIVVPPNCYQMTFPLTFSGAGSAKLVLTLSTMTKESNVLTASGNFVLNGLQAGRWLAQLQAKATAGTVTASVGIPLLLNIAGAQLLGGRATPGTGSGAGATGGTGSDQGTGTGDLGEQFPETELS